MVVSSSFMDLGERLADAFDHTALEVREQTRAQDLSEKTVPPRIFAFIVGTMVREALELRETIWKEAWGFLEETDYVDADVSAVGGRLEGLFKRWLNMLSRAHRDCTGGLAPGAAPLVQPLEGAIREVNSLLKSTQAEWPWPKKDWPGINREMVDKSRQQIAAGQLLDAEN